MTEPVQFSFSKSRLIILAVCLALICLVLFVAGMATGALLVGKSPTKQAELRLPVNRPESKAGDHAAIGDLPAQRAATSAPQIETATTLSQPAGPDSRQGLTVELSGLPDEAAAKRLAALLMREGYGASQTGSYSAQGQLLYFVRLGPFREWESASRVAGELRRSFDLQPSLLPVTTPS